MADPAFSQLPSYLNRYIVPQNQNRYTPVDQAVWRYILRQLKSYLSAHAHESYLDGLAQTGITTEEIPLIQNISERLSRFGWKALPVSGFIPPAAFMELQSLGILPIASDMRTLEHLLYTPAPDIVHEAAGHAPLLANQEYSDYLKQYAQVAKKALISKEDMDVYKAIRNLSDIKEHPSSTPAEIQKAEKQLADANAAVSHVSEASLLSRMNWWTAEYGLIGDLASPKIIGAGLLSSVGESELCLSDKVKKIPLSLDCIKYSYDITEPQPQLFVAQNFAHLRTVLEEMANTMAYRTGGKAAVEKAVLAETVNTVELDTGLQIGGVCKSQIVTQNGQVAYLSFEGPTQLAYKNQQIAGQGTEQHAHGFGTPVGLPTGIQNARFGMKALAPLIKNNKVELIYPSGVKVVGEYLSHVEQDGVLLILSLSNATATLQGSVLFDPTWGTYDMAVGTQVASVYAGPPDRKAYGETDDFHVEQVPAKPLTESEKTRFQNFQTVRNLRHSLQAIGQLTKTDLTQKLEQLQMTAVGHKNRFPQDWLLFLEAYEISSFLARKTDLDAAPRLAQEMSQILKDLAQNPQMQKLIQDGLKEVHKHILL